MFRLGTPRFFDELCQSFKGLPALNLAIFKKSDENFNMGKVCGFKGRTSGTHLINNCAICTALAAAPLRI